jgi:hypothetical protein
LLKPQGLFWPAAAWKVTFLSFVFGRKRPKTKEKDGFSMLPQPVLSLSKGPKRKQLSFLLGAKEERFLPCCRRRNNSFIQQTPAAQAIT